MVKKYLADRTLLNIQCPLAGIYIVAFCLAKAMGYLPISWWWVLLAVFL